ncbi:hypothetical protein ACFL40_04215 [candidate division KSB1 bacterium]
MKTLKLSKLLKKHIERDVPSDLRERLVDTIPGGFKEKYVEKAETRRFFTLRYKLSYIAAAAVVLIAVLIFSGLNLKDYPTTTPFNIVSVTLAEVIKNLENTGAFYIELDQRTRGGENFEYIDPESDFARINIWLEHPSERFKRGRMKIAKKEREKIFNGKATLFIFHFNNKGDAKLYDGGRIDEQLANPARWVNRHYPVIHDNVQLDTTVINGQSFTRLTIREKGIPITKGSPAFYMEFDRKTVISWDTKTKLLTGFEKYVKHKGEEILAARLRSIEYRNNINDEIFSHKLPDNVELMTYNDAENDRYSKMEPEEITRFIFDAWKNEEWDNVKIFIDSYLVLTYMKMNHVAGYKITGPKFKRTPDYPGYMVPYELIFKDGHTKKLALCLKYNKKLKRYVWDGGI